jgi:hypothetical protein
MTLIPNRADYLHTILPVNFGVRVKSPGDSFSQTVHLLSESFGAHNETGVGAKLKGINVRGWIQFSVKTNATFRN